MTNPTFRARFSDDVEIRMTIWHSQERATFDLKRGVVLARHAYASRMRKRGRHIRDLNELFDEPPIAIPPLVEAQFQEDGFALQTYGAEELAKVAR